MLIAQRCVSCKSVYGVQLEKYRHLIQVSCPSCGSPNKKQVELLKHGSLTITEASNCVFKTNVVTQPVSNQISNQVSNHKHKRPTTKTKIVKKSRESINLESLRRRIEDSGRCLVLGSGPSLNTNDLRECFEKGIPMIGVNDVFRACPEIDALVVGDTDFILSRFHKMAEWANTYMPNLFIMSQNRGHGISRKWTTRDGKHGILIDGNTGAVLENKNVDLNCSVYYWNRKTNIVDDIMFPIELFFKRTIILSAINLAYQLGAKEIYLSGVDLNNNRHCSSQFDKLGYEDNQFPHINEIQQIFKDHNGYYKQKGIRLINTSENSKIKDIVEFKNFNVATSMDNQIYLNRLGDKIKKLGKCFLFGAGDSLNDIPIQKLSGWPVIGVNTAFLKYPIMDALVFGDPGFIQQYSTYIREWQETREEKPILFWHGVSSSPNGHVKVVSWCHAPQGHSIWENRILGYNLMLSIKRSIITPAINLAYSLGAREIYLAGVDLNNNKHFWDSDESTAQKIGQPVGSFPGAGQITEFIQKQKIYLADRGVKLAKITKGGALDNILKTENLEDVADSRELNRRFFENM